MEIARLEAALRRVEARGSVVVAVAGEAGVGKTRLVNELADRAQAAGSIVLAGGCVDIGDGVFPYAPVAEALRRLAQHGEVDLDRLLGDARGQLARLVPEFGPPRGSAQAGNGVDPQPPSQLLELFLGLLQRMSADRPVLLVIEDLHWADRSTRELIAFLARNRPAAVLLVLTYRSHDVPRGHPSLALLAELERGCAVEHVDLARLGRHDLRQLMAGILGRPAPAELVRDILARSDGNPFFAEELLAAHRQGLAAPRALRDLVLTRVHALSNPAQRMLETAAVGGRRVDHELLAEVADLPWRELLELLREAIDQHVLVVERGGAGERYAFRHALVQEAICDDLLTTHRRRLHAAYADGLARRVGQDSAPGGRGMDAVTELAGLASHWRGAGDLERALPAFVQAGIAAGAAGAPAEALRCYEQAAQLWQQVPKAAAHSPLDQPAMLERAAEAAYLVSEHDRAIALATQALVQIDPEDRLRAGVLLAALSQYYWEAADGDRALSTIEQAVATVPERPPSRELAVVLAAHARVALMRADYEHARRSSERAVAVAREVGARVEEGQALITLGAAEGWLGRIDVATTHLEQARIVTQDVGDDAGLCRVYVNLSITLRRHGRTAEAVSVALEGSELARRFGLLRGKGVHMLVGAAETLIWLGRLEEADQLLDEVLDLDPPILDRIGALTARATGRLWRGDVQGARADLKLITDGATSPLARQYAEWAVGPLAEVAILEGQHAEARAVVSQALAVELGPHGGILPDPDIVIELCRAGLGVEAAIAEKARPAADELDTAVEHATTLLAHARSATTNPAAAAPSVAATLATAEAEWTRAIGESDPDRWARAAEAWETLAYPYPAAYARWRQADALLTIGTTRDQVAATIIKAWQQADDIGARPLAAQIELLARRARITLPAAPDETGLEGPSQAGDEFRLTDREREVLAQLADGRTNRQIAAALYISPKTASVHVSNILTKLNVANRTEAGALAHRLGYARKSA
jgi:DNA-binding CsgD family transcriptional regulator/tetratricopeptide (TPR) repeat protein